MHTINLITGFISYNWGWLLSDELNILLGQLLTLTRNVHSPVMCPSEAVSLLVPATVLKWWEQSLFAETTCIGWKSTKGMKPFKILWYMCVFLRIFVWLMFRWSIDTRKGIQTSLLTYPPASVWKRVTMSSSANAGQNWNRIGLLIGKSWTIWLILISLSLCRPLSKTVRFNVLKVIPAGSSGLGKKAFAGMWVMPPGFLVGCWRRFWSNPFWS